MKRQFSRTRFAVVAIFGIAAAFAPTVDDADEENAVFVRAVEDQVVADRKGAETGEKMIDRTPQVRMPDELTDDGAEAVDEAIRRIGIVPRDLNPNLDGV